MESLLRRPLAKEGACASGSRRVLLAVLLSLLLVQGAAEAQQPVAGEGAPTGPEIPDELDPETPDSLDPDVDEDEETQRWSGSLNLATSNSMAMFHPTEYVRSSGRSMSLSSGGSGRYRISDSISATAGFGFAYHLINPKDLSGRRFWLSDPSVRLSHGSLFRDEAYTGINVSGNLGASLGLSPSSRYWNRYGSLSGSVSASRSFVEGRVSVSWGLTGGVSFTRYSSPTTSKLSDDGLDMALARADGAELLAGDYNLVSGNAQLGSVGNTISLRFRALDGLTANLSLGISHSYRYCPPVDHLSSEAVDHHGDQIVRQGDVCRGDGMTGSFGAAYALADGLSLSASFNSAQPVFAYRGAALTEESRVMRFPFWDRDLHMTSFSMRVSKSF